MATSKLLKPTNVTISIPEFTDQPDQRVNSNCIDKEADAINSLNNQFDGFFKTPTQTLTGDLNNALTPGWYIVDASCTNKPPLLAAGKLQVIYSETTNYVRQIYFCGYDIHIYTRVRYYSGSWQWTSWVEVTNLDMYSLNRLLSPTTVNSTSLSEKSLSENWNNYRMLNIILLSSTDIVIGSMVIPTEIISSAITDFYVSYTSDSQTVVYTRFNTSAPGKVNVWSNNTNAKKVAIYGIMKKT